MSLILHWVIFSCSEFSTVVLKITRSLVICQVFRTGWLYLAYFWSSGCLCSLLRVLFLLFVSHLGGLGIEIKKHISSLFMSSTLSAKAVFKQKLNTLHPKVSQFQGASQNFNISLFVIVLYMKYSVHISKLIKSSCMAHMNLIN